jgi:hypothetical protein
MMRQIDRADKQDGAGNKEVRNRGCPYCLPDKRTPPNSDAADRPNLFLHNHVV